MKKRLYTVLTAFLSVSMLSAQTDEPCNATFLTVNTAAGCASNLDGLINPPTFSNSTNASSGVNLPTLSCHGFTTTTRDFWFRTVVPSGGALKINVSDSGVPATQTTNYWDMACYTSNSANCSGSSFALIAASTECLNDNYPDISLSGLTAGTTIYIRMWREAASPQTDNRAYNICVSDPTAAVPVCSALLNPVNATVLKQTPVMFWQANALATSYDVYLGTTNLPYFYLNTTKTQLSLPTLSPNQTNYWYVVPRNTAGVAVGCAANVRSFTTAAPITNDDCSSAIALSNGNILSGTTVYALQSRPAAYCSGGTSAYANDVWYKFTTNSVGGTASISVTTFLENGVSFDAVVEVLAGACNNLVSLGCVDAVANNGVETITLSSLPANSTYFVRVYGWQSAVGTGASYALFQPFDIKLTSSGVIPIELMAFSGKMTAKSNELDWQTASERHVDVFDIERSDAPEKGFASIGKLKAVGNSSAVNSYTFIDPSPFALSYYRLRSVDVDGFEQISKTITVQRTNNKLTINKIFPSPTTNDATIDFSTNETGMLEVTIFDLLGQAVLQKKVSVTEGGYLEKINVADMANGTYFVRLKSALCLAQARFIKN